MQCRFAARAVCLSTGFSPAVSNTCVRRFVRQVHAAAATPESSNGLKRKIGIAVFGTMIGTTVYLGTWQASRYGWKKDVIEKRREGLDAPYADITATSLADLSALETKERVHKVMLEGVIEADKQLRICPRPPPKSTPEHLIPTSGNRGNIVVAPLRRPDGTRIIIVRGWWPAEIPNPSAADAPTRLHGVLRSPEEVCSRMLDAAMKRCNSPLLHNSRLLRLPFVYNDGVASNRPFIVTILQPGMWAIPHRLDKKELSSLDVKAITEAWHLDPSETVIVEAIEEMPTSRGVFPLTKSLTSMAETYVMPSTHLIYAATWYTLATLGSVIAYYRFRKPIPGTARVVADYATQGTRKGRR